MLVVSRRPAFKLRLPTAEAAAAVLAAGGHGVRIGLGITVHVLEVHGGWVRLGIVAPAQEAVTRDDMPLADHLRRQEQRTAGQ